MYDKRNDLKRKQEIKMENHEFKLGDHFPDSGKIVDIFGRITNWQWSKCIYMIRNISTGRMYIGQTTDIWKRKSQHVTTLKQMCHENSDVQVDYILYGINSFIFEIIEFLNFDDNFLEKEKYWIKYFNTEYPKGYNSPYKENKEYSQRLSKHIVNDFQKIKKENIILTSGVIKNKKNIVSKINEYKNTHKDLMKFVESWKGR
jgi:group I intron endonuclease